MRGPEERDRALLELGGSGLDERPYQLTPSSAKKG